jgi:cytoskeletal protein RodZ
MFTYSDIKPSLPLMITISVLCVIIAFIKCNIFKTILFSNTESEIDSENDNNIALNSSDTTDESDAYSGDVSDTDSDDNSDNKDADI